MIQTTSQLIEEYGFRASQLNLNVDCPAGGTFNAQIAVVAEAPGDSEVRKRTPLIGASGQLLFTTLRKVGIQRSDCFITNVARRQVAFGKDDSKVPLGKREFYQWRDLLLWELSMLPNLRYVVAAGNIALAALVGKEGITQWRGSVLDAELPGGRKVKVICTFNPALIMRDPRTEISFNLDVRKLRRVMDGKHNPKPVEVLINPSFQEAMLYVETLEKEAKIHGTPIGLDIETMAMETACLGLGNSATQAMCINWRTQTTQQFSLEDERVLRRRIQSFFKHPDTKFIAQNGMFDLTWLWFKDKMRIPGIWFDTMLAHHLLYPTLPHNLGYITTQYTDHPFYKNELEEWRETGSIDDLWRYNGKDVCHMWEAHVRLEKELRAANLEELFHNHVMRAGPHLARMTVGGVLMDQSLREKISGELTEGLAIKLNEFHEACQEATGDPSYSPNPRSPTQVSELLFRRLKLVGRGASTDKTNRQRMYEHPRTNDAAKRVLTRLNEYTKEAKFFSTYVDIQIDQDNRARCEYKQTGVAEAPGRLSSSKTLWGSGMNLQNQPYRAYSMFIADPGYGFAYFDMAQAEARLVAIFANIVLWKEQFERARLTGTYDAHRALASEMFGIPYDEVPTNDHDEHGTPTLRYISKRCRHGLNYRMGPDKLAMTTNLPEPEAFRAYNAYHRTTPELRRWWAKEEREIRETKKLYNAFGRRMIVLERLTNEALESIVAFKPQSTLGDHVVRIIYQSEDDPQWPKDARIALNIHDALIALAPVDKLPLCAAIMKRYAEQPIVIGAESLIIPADVKLSVPGPDGIHRWSTLSKYKGTLPDVSGA